MASASTINEPFLLASYSVTSRISESKAPIQRNQPGIYASYQKPTAASDGFVSVACQSDGVHVVDVTTLHPIISYTLGPSTSFTCPPLTKYDPSKNIYTTFGVIASSPDIDVKHQRKTIWQWSENFSSKLTERSSSSAKKQHQSIVVPHVISGLYDCAELPDRILAISPFGDISLLTIDLELKASRAASVEEHSVIFAQVLSRSLCSFLGSKTEGAAIILVARRASSIQMEVYCVGPEDSIDAFVVHEIPLDSQVREIATTSCSLSGSLNIILQIGLWYSFLVTPSAITPVASPVKLSGLSFNSPTPSSPSKKLQKKPSIPAQVSVPSLLALTSSHVLLASQTLQNEIALLLWDSQYSVLLASYLLPLPSSLTSQTSPLALSLLPLGSGVKAGNQQAILVLSQLTLELDGKTPVKSSIYVVPYRVPVRSTLANAIGHGDTGKKWLDVCEVEEKGGYPQDAAREKIVEKIRVAIEQNRPQVANELFTEWEKKEEEQMKDLSADAVIFGYSFVKDLLEAFIQPQKPPSPMYSSEVVRHLIVKGVVRSSMLAGGLLASLRVRSDWASIDLALRNVPDLSEDELMESLYVIVNHTSPPNPNTMQVDSTSTLDQTPSLQEFLRIMLKHREFTATQLIIAFRRHLRSSEVVTSVVGLLDDWMKKVQSQEMKLMPGKKAVKKNNFGAFVIKEDMVKPRSIHDLPSMNQILHFLQSLLDATFLMLLQHPPAHKILRSLKTHIELEISALSKIGQLRGLVEIFAQVHKKAVKDAEERKATKDKNTGAAAAGKEGSKQDWRQRKREGHGQVGMAVGVYSLEELVL